MSWTWTATEAHLPLEGLGRQTGQTLRTGGPGGDETAERSPRGWRPGRPRACVQEALKAQLGDRERPLNGSKEEKSALREGWRETRGRVPSSRREMAGQFPRENTVLSPREVSEQRVGRRRSQGLHHRPLQALIKASGFFDYRV